MTGPAPRRRLLVNLLTDFLETFENGIDVLGLHHEFLEAFHAGLGHVGWRVTVEELSKSISARQQFETGLDERIIADRRFRTP